MGMIVGLELLLTFQAKDHPAALGAEMHTKAMHIFALVPWHIRHTQAVMDHFRASCWSVGQEGMPSCVSLAH